MRLIGFRGAFSHRKYTPYFQIIYLISIFFYIILHFYYVIFPFFYTIFLEPFVEPDGEKLVA